jgi:hypothetical protein
MKRIGFKGLVLVLILLVALVGEGFAQMELKQKELETVNVQIKFLDQRIAKAQKAKQVSQLIRLRAEREKLVKQMRQLEAEIAKLSSATSKPAPSVSAEKAGFLVEAGYGGGAGIIGAGYELPLGGMNLQLRADYGIGNKFSIVAGMLSSAFPFENYYLGLEVGVANYSERVSGVPGISGTIDKGSRVGFGVFAGTKVGVVKVQAGYDTALGLTAGISYKF